MTSHKLRDDEAKREGMDDQHAGVGLTSHRGPQKRATLSLIALVIAVMAALAAPPVALAKTTIYGIRHYRPPVSDLLSSPTFPRPPPPLFGVKFAKRAVVAEHSSAYRPKGLSLPVMTGAGRRSAHTSSVNLYAGPGFPGLIDRGSYPADAQVAVSRQQLVEMTNSTVAVYGHDGLRLDAFPMSQILGFNAQHDIGDPQIAWDQQSQRWIAAGMDVTANTTEISVSNGPDPRGGWFDYSFPYGSTLCPDQPRLGFSSLVVVVATELFGGSCRSNGAAPVQGAVLVVVDKQALLAHAIPCLLASTDPTRAMRTTSQCRCSRRRSSTTWHRQIITTRRRRSSTCSSFKGFRLATIWSSRAHY